MTCLSPPPTDAELLAYLDGDSSLAAHIAQCPQCRARAQALAQTENLLTKTFARIECPSALELGEYELGLLSSQRSGEIAAHLQHCPSCARELATLQTYLQATETAPAPAPLTDLGDKIKTVIATLVQDFGAALSGPGRLSPAMAGVRGNEAAPQIYQAGEYQLALQLQEDPEKPDKRALYGLLIGDNPGAFEVQLWQAEEVVAHAQVDEYGNFTITEISPGNYSMRLIRPQLSIQLDDVGL